MWKNTENFHDAGGNDSNQAVDPRTYEEKQYSMSLGSIINKKL
jgi:hypothetical protein